MRLRGPTAGCQQKLAPRSSRVTSSECAAVGQQGGGAVGGFGSVPRANSSAAAAGGAAAASVLARATWRSATSSRQENRSGPHGCVGVGMSWPRGAVRSSAELEGRDNNNRESPGPTGRWVWWCSSSRPTGRPPCSERGRHRSSRGGATRIRPAGAWSVVRRMVFLKDRVCSWRWSGGADC